MDQPTTEAVAGKFASMATYAGAGGAAASGLASDTVLGLTTNQWSVAGVIGGLMIAMIGLLVSVYFKRQHLKIAREKHEADSDE